MTETKIKAALIQLHAGIKKSDGPVVSAALTEIEALHSAHRAELSPQLDHFLSGRSYAKALAYLGGADELTAKPALDDVACNPHAPLTAQSKPAATEIASAAATLLICNVALVTPL